MKKVLKTIAAFAVILSVTTSCVNDDDFAIPTIYNYVYKDGFDDTWSNWTKYSVTGDQEWQLDTQFGNPGNCAKISGYVSGTNYVNEDWLISPVIDLSTVTGATLSFDTAKNYSGNDLEIYVSNDYNGGEPSTATWTQVTATLSSGSWTWISSGAIDVSAYDGGNLYVAFKYTCTSSASTTWEVDNIKIIKN